ncbi:MAG: AAA family ATPase [Limnohabitans sp.]|nr:MAG: AAA family ATPase [Limnohabitans sp.]
MVRRIAQESRTGQIMLPPGLAAAPVLDLMCTHFVLTLAQQQGAQFNLRRDLAGLLPLCGRHLVWPVSVLARLRRWLAQRVAAHEAWAGHERLAHREFLDRFALWRGPYDESTLFFYLDDYGREVPKDLMGVLSASAQWLAHSLKKQSTQVQKNIDVLARLLQLNAAEQAVLLYGTLARYQRDLRSLLVEFKVNNAPEAHAALAEVAGVNAAELAEALRTGSRLERVGLVDNLLSEHAITDLSDLMKVSDKLPPVLMREYSDTAELMAVFTRPSLVSALAPTDFDFVADDVRVLRKLLARAVERGEVGVNILLYGPPGTGKTELARVVAQAAGLKLFEVEHSDREGHSLSGRDRYRSLQIAQAFLKGSAQAVLLFDEVEDVFPPLSMEASQRMARAEQVLGHGSQSVSGKAWVNQILETNPVPTVWVTNRIEQIDPAFRRRFAYHLELTSPPPGAREQLVRKALADHAVTDALVARLSARQDLTPAQIHTAVRFAALAQGEGATLDTLIERQLAHADQALGRVRSPSQVLPQVTHYRLDWLNVESRHEVPRIVQALQARGHGTLCFHGVPGSGKSALAAHIAQTLGKPLQIRQSSDLMSKYVGETEQNMAAMFAQAEREGAVLLLDEADSFLQDRRGAQRHYEVTEVNEMLQGMERFRGVFICTTNLMDQLDAAALRRFAFKLKFLPLRREQREAMFITEALAGHAQDLTTALRERLALLDQLCLGDFAAVQRQAQILAETLDAEAFMAQLEAEHRIKPEVRERRSMGFTH